MIVVFFYYELVPFVSIANSLSFSFERTHTLVSYYSKNLASGLGHDLSQQRRFINLPEIVHYAPVILKLLKFGKRRIGLLFVKLENRSAETLWRTLSKRKITATSSGRF